MNEMGGKIVIGAGTVLVNGLPIGTHPSPISDHAPYGKNHRPHATAFTVAGSSTVFAEGKPALVMGAKNTCGHTIIQSSSDVAASA